MLWLTYGRDVLKTNGIVDFGRCVETTASGAMTEGPRWTEYYHSIGRTSAVYPKGIDVTKALYDAFFVDKARSAWI